MLPSFSENFGIAAVEAMLAGLALVLAEGVAVAGDVREAAAGIIVEPSPHSIASGLEKLVEDADLRMDMGQNAVDYARSAYDPKLMAKRLLDLYSASLQRRYRWLCSTP